MHDHGIQVHFVEQVAKTGGQRRELRGGPAELIHGERAPVAAAPEQGCQGEAINQSPGFRGIEWRQGVDHVRQRLDVQPAESEQHDGPELVVVNHAEQHLDALLR